MAAVVMPAADGRTARLTALVSGAEAEQIARQAAAAGLSVSAYLRERALGGPIDASDAAALQQVDVLIDRMEAELDSAIAVLSATMVRIDAAA
jgi:hypothetical protein